MASRALTPNKKTYVVRFAHWDASPRRGSRPIVKRYVPMIRR